MMDTDFDLLCDGVNPAEAKLYTCEKFWPNGAAAMKTHFRCNWPC